MKGFVESYTILNLLAGKWKIIKRNISEEDLSKMGLSEVSRDVTPPVAPSAKKKNIPAKSFGCKSLALAFSSWHVHNNINLILRNEQWHHCWITITYFVVVFLPHPQKNVFGNPGMFHNHPWQRAQQPTRLQGGKIIRNQQCLLYWETWWVHLHAYVMEA